MSTISTGVYYIQNVGTNTVLDLDKGSSTNGTPVQGFTKRELTDQWVPAQLWIVAQSGIDSVYTIQNANGRTYMEIPNGNTQKGTRIVGAERSGEQSQLWKITRNEANTGYVIGNQASNTYVDLYNGGKADGTAVNGWASSAAATTNVHQLWNFISV